MHPFLRLQMSGAPLCRGGRLCLVACDTCPDPQDFAAGKDEGSVTPILETDRQAQHATRTLQRSSATRSASAASIASRSKAPVIYGREAVVPCTTDWAMFYDKCYLGLSRCFGSFDLPFYRNEFRTHRPRTSPMSDEKMCNRTDVPRLGETRSSRQSAHGWHRYHSGKSRRTCDALRNFNGRSRIIVANKHIPQPSHRMRL